MGVYLTNCNEFESGHTYSNFDYYTNAKSGSQNQQKPDASTTVDSTGFETWEGHQVYGFFSGRQETFCSNIAADGSGLVCVFFFTNQTTYSSYFLLRLFYYLLY